MEENHCQCVILLPISLAGDKSQPMKPGNRILFCSVAAKLQGKRIEEQFHTIPAIDLYNRMTQERFPGRHCQSKEYVSLVLSRKMREEKSVSFLRVVLHT